VAGLVLVIEVVRSRSESDVASREDVLDSEGRLHQRLDEVAAAGSGVGDRIDRLPPFPHDLLLSAGDECDRVWQVIAPFTDAAVDPRNLAREWAEVLFVPKRPPDPRHQLAQMRRPASSLYAAAVLPPAVTPKITKADCSTKSVAEP
jgi:hypothetical protein